MPKGVGTNTPDDIAEAVATAIEKNRGEIDVAPFSLRAAAMFAGIAPDLAAKVNRIVGGEKVAADMAAGHAEHR